MSSLTLRPYQKTIVDNIVDKKPQEGIIFMSTGSGKSIVALELLCQLGLGGTVLVPNTILLRQFESECVTHYGYSPGIVGDGEKVIKRITIAIWQSLRLNPDLLYTLAKQTSVLFVDECQGAVSDKRLETLEKFAPRYLFGLTGTPYRSTDDGKTDAISFYFGEVIAEYKETLLKPTIHVINPRVPIAVDDYPRMIEKMVTNKSRNNCITCYAKAEMMQDRKILILTKRVAHYKEIASLLPQDDRVVQIDSSNKDRHKLLRDLKTTGNFNIILGTFSLLGTGFDIPSLDTLFIAGDIKSNCLTTQSAGRILRFLKGKDPRIYDIADMSNPILRRQYYARKREYDRHGWIVLV